GVIDGMMATARLIFRSDRILLAMMPAFLGFLPSLGGAIFSAPLVERAASQYALSAETKTTINYWFRHVWEFTNPIFTGMLLASHISGIPLSVLVTHMAWLTLFSLAIGWLFLISPLRRPQAAHTAPPKSSDNGYRYLVLAAGPVVANFVLVIAFNFSASAAMALVVAAMAFVLRQSFADVRAMFAAAFDRKMLWGIVGILFFQNILRQTGVIGDVA
ncbi:MAG: DUF401 family protein, partial [Negativicutes bacterium]|nr:DUF401 family protein [Negativicutes bacterium]